MTGESAVLFIGLLTVGATLVGLIVGVREVRTLRKETGDRSLLTLLLGFGSPQPVKKRAHQGA